MQLGDPYCFGIKKRTTVGNGGLLKKVTVCYCRVIYNSYQCVERDTGGFLNVN